jgi:hypothetical protein
VIQTPIKSAPIEGHNLRPRAKALHWKQIRTGQNVLTTLHPFRYQAQD